MEKERSTKKRSKKEDETVPVADTKQKKGKMNSEKEALLARKILLIVFKYLEKNSNEASNTFFAFLRAVNVGGNNMVPMAKLRDVLSSSHLAFRNVQTLLQTGNIIFECTEKTDSETLAKKIRSEIESEFGVQTAVMLRTEEDLKIALKNCPFDTEEGGGADPSRVLLMFLERSPTAEGIVSLENIAKGTTDVVRLLKSDDIHLYFHHPDGIARSKLAKANFERLTGSAGTARNLNTIRKLLTMAKK